MKIREIKATSGEAVSSQWPPSLGGFLGSGYLPRPGDGTLKSVRIVEDRLEVMVEHAGSTYSRQIQCDAPPDLKTLERKLLEHIGESIQAIGELEI